MAGPKDKPEKANGDAAWQRLTATTNPLPDKSRNRHVAAAQNSPAKAANKSTIQSNSKANSKARPKAGAPIKQAVQPPIGTARNLPPQGDIMPRTRRRLARGTLPIAARLDLHGLSLVEAERALTAFVVGARAQGQVWLLVITGKGSRGEGKLRRGLPEWLERGALAGQIVEYGPAAANHGGAGAFYLRLRRSPPKG